MGEAADDRGVRGRGVGAVTQNEASLPRRSCRQPAASGRAQGGARQARARRDLGRSAQSDRRPRDRARHSPAGGDRPAIDHRRRVPPRVLELRLPRRARRRRSLSRRAQDQVSGTAAEADDAARDRQARRFQRPPDDRAFPLRAGAHQGRAEDDDPLAVLAALPLRPRCGARRRSIRRWTISIATSGQAYRKAVRAFADAGCRYLQLDEVNFAYLCDPKLRQQVSERGDDPDMLPGIYAGMINTAISDIPADMTIAMHLVPRQFPVDLRRLGRLRAGGGAAVQHHQGATAISWNTTASAPAASSRCVSCRRARRWCSAL